ncbi:SRPBCC family protein [Prescottella agglutinans]|uniref:SRPBCC family protein n=1 Tax=Prescottella agglutinans TaxID=1644129 RepID=A0A3S3BB98_9NOCA|nr:SRPBCC family protein [Prescottella agglutinans]RVW07345.1 SRPBCC family protein [Prescottella agglutinans]
MDPQPQGALDRALDGVDLRITRTFDAPIADVWASITESERTATWFGPWEGEPGAGNTIRVQLAFEEDKPWSEMLIDGCEPPRHLALSVTDPGGSWRLSADLREVDGATELSLTHHGIPVDTVAEVGPGWEYYLDMLVAARQERALPEFGDYFPAQSEYYRALAADLG